MGVFLFALLQKSWFIYDDFDFLQDAHAGGLSLDTLFRPTSGHILPVTRIYTWVLLLPGEPSWLIASLIIVALFLISCWSLWWLLKVCFQDNRLSLLPFTLYATSATVALWATWWSMAIQELMLAITFFNAIGWAIKYFRSRQLLPLALTYFWWLIGMLSFEKSMIILIIIPAIALAYFSTGRPWQRIQQLWSKYKIAVITTFIAALGMTSLYFLNVPETKQSKLDPSLIWPLLNVMLGETIWPMLLGGPLQWSNKLGSLTPNPPAIYFNVVLVSIALTVAFLALKRRRVGRAISLVALSFLFAFMLLLITRALVLGPPLGYLYRYQGEVYLAAILALSLSLMPLSEALEPSETRKSPILDFTPKPIHVVGIAIVIVVCSLVSTVTYYNSWSALPMRAKAYMANLSHDLHKDPSVVIVGANVPDQINWAVKGTYGQIESMIAPFGLSPAFNKPTTNLRVVDDNGNLRPASIEIKGQTKKGPHKDCGWRVSAAYPVSIPMEQKMITWSWWARLGYMTGQKTTVRITAGDTVFQKDLSSGFGDIFFPTDGDFDSIDVEVLTQGSTLCLDKAVIGDAVPQQK
jgi:hypothetical protein